MDQKVRKQMILNIPYAVLGLSTTNLGEAWKISEGMSASEKLQNMILNGSFQQALSNPLPSFYPLDLTVGIYCALVLRLTVYLKGKNTKKFRYNEEYGSARWGTHADIEPYEGPIFENNMILLPSERLTMNSKPKNPKHARNKNVLAIDGSGSDKTRFVLKPNPLQMHSSYVITDPKGTVLSECGKALQIDPVKKDSEGKPMKNRNGRLIHDPYHIRMFNTINFKRSMHYNPFAYIHSEKDILKLTTTLIANIKGDGKAGDEFWTSATRSPAVESWRTHDYGRADN